MYNINTAPTVTGQFTRDGADVKVYTGGVVKNLTDIGTGGGTNLIPLNNVFTGINQFTNASTFNVSASNINFGSGAGIVNVIGKLSLSNIGAPTSVGQFTRDGSDVKVYTGGVVKNLTDIGTGGGGVSLGGTNTWTGVNTYNTYVKLNGNNRITGTQTGNGSTANRGIGFFTQTTTTGVGDYGSIGIPYYNGIVGNASDCDAKFGSAKGCIGLSLNSGNTPHLCIKVATSGSSKWFKLLMNSGTNYVGYYV